MSIASENPSFFARIFLAWVAYFRVLFDGDFAGGVARLRAGALPAPEPEEKPAEKQKEPPKESKPVVLREATPDAACQLLALLQREGRLLDFLQEDLSDADDADVGAAARVVHEGCKKALEEHFEIVPIREEEEGSKVAVEKGFNAGEVRLTGNVVGEAPFSGTLSHRGWKAAKVTLPKMTKDHDATVLAPAEVEL